MDVSKSDGSRGLGRAPVATPVPENASPEAIRSDPEVQQAFRAATGSGQAPPPRRGDRLMLGSYALVLLGFAAIYFLLQTHSLPLGDRWQQIFRRLTIGAGLVVLVIAATKILDVFVLQRLNDPVSRYNITRIVRLLAGLVVIFIVISVLFVNWYAAFVSLGVLSLVLGFALQTPITSFIGWIYILARNPYRVGDRVKIEEVTGDVIEVSYLDTTLWEFGGQYLSSDHPSGRIVKFPNSKVLNSAVFNYSWPLFPYIWNEIKFQIAYASDLAYVSKTMQEVAEREIGADMTDRVRVFQGLLAKTPVDELQVQDRPVVLFRVSDNTWIEAIVRYLVHPKQSGRVKTALITKLLAELNREPGRVLFPKGDAR
jgi:small-conductance mechanosensitive channel